MQNHLINFVSVFCFYSCAYLKKNKSQYMGEKFRPTLNDLGISTPKFFGTIKVQTLPDELPKDLLVLD